MQTAGEGERPQWAGEYDQLVEYNQGGIWYKLPPSVNARLSAPLSGVPGSTSPAAIFACFDVTPRDTELKLEKYYNGSATPDDKHAESDAGLWVLMRKAAPMDE